MSGDILLCFYMVSVFFICVFQIIFVILQRKTEKHGNAYFCYRWSECRHVGDAQ